MQVLGELAQRRHVIQDPEAAAVGRRHEVRALDLEVVDGDPGELAVERLPRRPVVERDVGRGLRSGVQQARPHRIREDHAREVVRGNSTGDPRPGHSVVAGLEEVGGAILQAVAMRGQVDGAGVVGGRVDRRDRGPTAELRGSDLLPARPVVARDVHAAVVTARPEHAGLRARLGKREHRAVDLRARSVLGDRTARGPELLGIGARQIGADRLPGPAVVPRAEDPFAAGVEHARVVRREGQREGPLKAVLLRAHVLAEVVLGPDRHELHLLGLVVVAQDGSTAAARAPDRPGVDDVGVLGIDGDVSALREAHRVAVAPADVALARAARDADRRVVLLRRVEPVRELVVQVHVVELCRRLVVDRREALAPVIGDTGAAVVALDHAPRVLGVDPQVVVVAVWGGDAVEAATSVGRLHEREVQAVDRLGVPGVGHDVAVVPGATEQRLVRADPLPGVASVLRAVEATAALGRLDQRPDAAAARGRCADPHAPEKRLGETGVPGDLVPALAAVRGAVQARVGAAAAHLPRGALRVPERGVQHARISRIEPEVTGTGGLAAKEHLLPGRSAVRGLVDASLRARAEDIAERRDPDGVGVLRMNAHAGDVTGGLESSVLPGAPRVDRAIHAVAVRYVVAHARLAHAGVDHLCVRRRDGDRTDRGGREKAVRDVAPVAAAVVGLPDPSGAGPEVEHGGVAGVAGDRHHPAAPRWPRAPPGQALQKLGGDGHFGGLRMAQAFLMVRPPSTGSTAPVMYCEAGSAKCRVPWAISSGSA